MSVQVYLVDPHVLSSSPVLFFGSGAFEIDTH